MEYSNQYFKQQTLFWKLFEKLTIENASEMKSIPKAANFVLPKQLIPLELNEQVKQNIFSEVFAVK